MAKDKKVLIVDDDTDILESLKYTFEILGFIPRATGKGEEVSVLISEFNPDIILLDVLLSGIDGRNICKELKTNDKTKHIPIVMISAHPDAEKSTIEAGADAFLAKPFEVDELMEQVNKLINQ